MKPLVIGLGNPDRGDDGAGLAVVARLTGDELELRTARGEATELLLLFEGRDTVYLVDATQSGSPAGTVHRLEGGQLPASRQTSTHGLGVAEAVELARVLGRLPRRLIVLGIEGRDFQPGAPLSPPVRRSVARVARQLQAESGNPSDHPSRSNLIH